MVHRNSLTKPLRPGRPTDDITKKTMKKITITSGTGFPKGSAVLVRWTSATLRKTHNLNTRFKYQSGVDASGVEYETKSRGGGWRVKR